MMLHLLIDFETSGLDPAKDRIIEIGADLVDNKWGHIMSLSTLVYHPDVTITDEITEITGITQEDLFTKGISISEAMTKLRNLMVQAVYYVAYNAAFDQSFYIAEEKRLVEGVHLPLPDKHWLCAMNDIDTNYNFKCKKLSHIALDHGVHVNPDLLHRAIDDVNLMREFLIATGKTPQDLYNFKAIPWVYLQALVPAPWTDKGVGTTLAKKAGFSYERCGYDERTFDKSWVKKVKKHQVEEFIKNSPFKIKELI